MERCFDWINSHTDYQILENSILSYRRALTHETAALETRKLHTKETELEEERQKLLGLEYLNSPVVGTNIAKRNLYQNTDSEEGVNVNRGLNVLKEEGTAQGSKRIKLEKGELRWRELDKRILYEKVDVKCYGSDVDEASVSDDENELERLVADLSKQSEPGDDEETELERFVADSNQQKRQATKWTQRVPLARPAKRQTHTASADSSHAMNSPTPTTKFATSAAATKEYLSPGIFRTLNAGSEPGHLTMT